MAFPTPRPFLLYAWRDTASLRMYSNPVLVWLQRLDWTLLPASEFAGSPEPWSGVALQVEPKTSYDTLPFLIQFANWTP